MGHSKERLTDVRLKSATNKLLKSETRGMLADGGGLYLAVIPPAASSWVYRYMLNGDARSMGLGSYPDISLAEAREEAAKWRKVRAQGRDPIEVRRAEGAAARAADAKQMTFEQCADAYIEAHRKSWTNAKHAEQWKVTLASYVNPIIGNEPVSAIDTALVLRVLEQKVRDRADGPALSFWTARPETANRVRGRIESVLGWATARNYRQGGNPARWRGHLKTVLPARSKVRGVKHLAAMPYAEIGSFMPRLRAQEGGPVARALEFAILTTARTDEVLSARWSEIDLSARTWTRPADHMKNGREHRIVLSDAAAKVLGDPGQPGDLVFAGAGGIALGDKSMLSLMRSMGRNETVHGFRASFKTWTAERTGYPDKLIEYVLAHTVGDALDRAYQRGDMVEKRRRLMADWAGHCDGQNVVDDDANLVPLKQRA